MLDGGGGTVLNLWYSFASSFVELSLALPAERRSLATSRRPVELLFDTSTQIVDLCGSGEPSVQMPGSNHGSNADGRE